MEDLFLQMRNFARSQNVPVMLDDSLKLLYSTVKNKQPKRILEIGTAIGYSGTAMLMASQESELFTIDMDENVQKIAKENYLKAGVLDRVTIWTGDACEIVRYLTGTFDFILLDGPKGHYYEFLPYLNKVLLKDGIIFADNVLFKGYTEASFVRHKHHTIVKSLRNYLDAVNDKTQYESTLYDIGDGVCITKKIK